MANSIRQGEQDNAIDEWVQGDKNASAQQSILPKSKSVATAKVSDDTGNSLDDYIDTNLKKKDTTPVGGDTSATNAPSQSPLNGKITLAPNVLPPAEFKTTAALKNEYNDYLERNVEYLNKGAQGKLDQSGIAALYTQALNGDATSIKKVDDFIQDGIDKNTPPQSSTTIFNNKGYNGIPREGEDVRDLEQEGLLAFPGNQKQEEQQKKLDAQKPIELEQQDLTKKYALSSLVNESKKANKAVNPLELGEQYDKIFGEQDESFNTKQQDAIKAGNKDAEIISQNINYKNESTGLDALYGYENGVFNDLKEQYDKNPTPDLLSKLQDQAKEISTISDNYNNLYNKYPQVADQQFNRFIKDDIAANKTSLLPHFYTSEDDVDEAIQRISQTNPNFQKQFAQQITDLKAGNLGLFGNELGSQGIVDAIRRGSVGVGRDVGRWFMSREERAAMDLSSQYKASDLPTSFAASNFAPRIVLGNDGKTFIPVKNDLSTTFNNAVNFYGEAAPGILEFAGLEELGTASKLFRGADIVTNFVQGGADIDKGILTANNANKTVGLLAAQYGTSYIKNYDDAYYRINPKTADELGKVKTMAHLYTLSEALAFKAMGISPNEIVQGTLRKTVGEDIYKFLTEDDLSKVTNEQLSKKMYSTWKDKIPAILKASGQEGLKMGSINVIQQAFKDGINKAFVPNSRTAGLDQYTDLFKSGAALGGVFGLLGNLRNYKDISPATGDVLYNLGANSDKYSTVIEKAVKDGIITQDRANDLMKIVNTAHKSIQDMGNKTYDDGTPLKDEDKIKLTKNNFRDAFLSNLSKEENADKEKIKSEQSNIKKDNADILGNSPNQQVDVQVDPETFEVDKITPIGAETTEKESAPSIEKMSGADVENRMSDLEDKMSKTKDFEEAQQHGKEFNSLEKEMEKRERASVFNVPLENVNDAVDALIKKEKEQPNGYGSFIQKSDARETKEVANKYLNPKDISDEDLKKDFKDALLGNPDTWYADGLKLRESAKESANRGIPIEDLLKEATDIYVKDGYDLNTAKNVIAQKLKPIFENSTSEPQSKEVPSIESQKNNVNSQPKIEEDAKNIIAGKTIFERFSPQEQRGLAEGGANHVEASLLLGRGEGAGGQDNTTPEAQENRVEQFAKDKGIWTDNTTEELTQKYGEPIAAGEEAIVWHDSKTGKVIKTQDTFQYDNLQQKLDGITLHNAYFPEAPLKVLGFGRNGKGEFQVIVEQPFIKGEKLTPEEIKNHLEGIGFKEDENGHFSNGDTIVEDIHTGNAIKTPEGNIIVIDPIMRLNTPEQGYGGERKINNNVSENISSPIKTENNENKKSETAKGNSGIGKAAEGREGAAPETTEGLAKELNDNSLQLKTNQHGNEKSSQESRQEGDEKSGKKESIKKDNDAKAGNVVDTTNPLDKGAETPKGESAPSLKIETPDVPRGTSKTGENAQGEPTSIKEAVQVSNESQPNEAANALQGSYDRLIKSGNDPSDPEMVALKKKIDDLAGKPPKPPTTEKTQVNSEERKAGQRSMIQRVIAGSNFLSDEEKKGFENNLNYEISNRKKTTDLAKGIIKEMGADEALDAVRNNQVPYSVQSAIYAGLINDNVNIERDENSTNEQKVEAANKWKDLFNEYGKWQTGLGQGIAYVDEFYNSPAGMVLDLRRKYESQVDEAIKKGGEGVQSSFEDIVNHPAFKDKIQAMIDDRVKEALKSKKKAATKEQKQKITDFFDSLKLKKDNLYALPIPPPVINAAIEAMKQATLAGYDVAKIIQEGINSIRDNHKEAFDEDDFRKQYEDKLTNLLSQVEQKEWKGLVDSLKPKDKIQSAKRSSDITQITDGLRKINPEMKGRVYQNMLSELLDKKFIDEKTLNEIASGDTDLGKVLSEFSDDDKKKMIDFMKKQSTSFLSESDKQKILEGWRKKLGNVDRNARGQLLNKALEQLTKNGALDYDDFKQMYAEAIGLKRPTPEMETELMQVGKDLNDFTDAAKRMDKERTDESIAAFKEAQKKAFNATIRQNQILGENQPILDKLLGLARMNTLGIWNVVAHPFMNLFPRPVFFVHRLFETGLDYGLHYGGISKNYGVKENVFYKQRAYFGEAPAALKKSWENAIGNRVQESAYEAGQENIDFLKGYKSVGEFFKNPKSIKEANLKKSINEFIDSFPLMGMSASLIQRGFQFGFTLPRMMSEAAEIESIGRQKGLSGKDLEIFKLNPDEESKQQAIEAGKRAVFQQDNYVTKKLDKLDLSLKGDKHSKFWERITGNALRVVGTGSQPFLKTPLNAALFTARVMIPELNFIEAIYHGVKGDRKEMVNSLAWGLTSMSIGYGARLLAKNNIIVPTPTGKNEYDKFKFEGYLNQYIPTGSFNMSAFRRMMVGKSTDFQDGDVLVKTHFMGALGSILDVAATRYSEYTPEQEAQLEKERGMMTNYFTNLGGDLKASLIDGMQSGVFDGTSSMLNAIHDGSPNSWLRGMTDTYVNVFEPSYLANWSRISTPYKPDFSAMGTGEMLTSELKDRFFMGGNLPSKITPWGEKQTDLPKGVDPFSYYTFDITRHKNLDATDFGYNIAALALRTRDKNVIPSRPSRSLNGVDLSPTLYEEYQSRIGQYRKQMTQALMSTDDFNKADDADKITLLKSVYSQGLKIGKDEFIFAHPEFEK